MYTDEKMKELLTERDKLGPNDEYLTEIIWAKMLELLQSKEGIDAFAEYMLNEMTYDEYGTLGEIIDEIQYKYITRNFVEALRKLIEKYPYNLPVEEHENEIENIMLRIFEAELEQRGE